MMRSPKAMSIAVRRPSGEIVVREEPWRSINRRFKFLKWPFLRGTVVFIEAMVNGIQALTFSANQALEEEEGGPLSPWAMVGTITLAVALAMGLFVALPHLLSLLAGKFLGPNYGVQSLTFHLIDGILKMIFFLTYILSISLLKDVKRLFMYHGAEHMSIHAYEMGEELTVEAARKYQTLHPRCGTAFLLLVLCVSIAFFAIIFPLLPRPDWPGWVVQTVFIAFKIALMMPIAGCAYEVTRLAGKKHEKWWIKPIIWPGMALQKLTTRPPTDDQLEIALTALKSAIKIEEAGA